MCKDKGISLFVALLTALKILFHRYTGQNDIIVGCPFANRIQEELEDVVGLFMNLLPIATDIDSDSTFVDLVDTVRIAVTKAPPGIACHPAVSEAVDQAAGILSDAGYAVEPADPPLVAEVAACWRSLLTGDLRLMVEPAIREHGSSDIVSVIDSYVASTAEPDFLDYARTLADRTRLPAPFGPSPVTVHDDGDMMRPRAPGFTA